MEVDTKTKKNPFFLQKLQNYQVLSRWSRVKESILTSLVGWIPRPFGVLIRKYIYRLIFARQGKALAVQEGVDIVGAEAIEIGNKVTIKRDVCLNVYAAKSKISLKDEVLLNRGVDIKTTRKGNCHIEIGESTLIGPYTCIAGPGHIKIGASCLIASHGGIYASQHIFADPNRRIQSQGVSYEGIVIEDDCWLGTGVKVLDGVTIGQGSVIGAGAVVTKDIPPYSIAVGVPACVISSRKSSELVSSTRHQEYSQDGSHLPRSLIAALTEVEKTAQLLYQCLQTANSNMPPYSVFEKLLQALLDCIHQIMQVDTVTLLLQTEGGRQLAVCATLGLEEEIATGIRIPIGLGFAGNIAASSESIIVEDLSQVEVVSPILRNKGIQSIVGVPLLAANRMIGVFHIGTYSHRQFTEDEAKLLQTVADRLGLAIAPLLELRKLASSTQAVRRESVSSPRLKLKTYRQACWGTGKQGSKGGFVFA
jgi:acetyltransferase-like isoleucine patch superfamily enzyme/putative methionine-R-sulfoxide reductase with GAF domain